MGNSYHYKYLKMIDRFHKDNLNSKYHYKRKENTMDTLCSYKLDSNIGSSYGYKHWKMSCKFQRDNLHSKYYHKGMEYSLMNMLCMLLDFLSIVYKG